MTNTTKEELENIISFSVGVLLDRFENSPEENRMEFYNCKEDQLIIYHHSLGRAIRNEFGLWSSIKWEPVLKDGIDYSEFHPDSVSQEIIKRLWRKLHGTDLSK